MPLYTYVCLDCCQESEELLSFDETKTTVIECPDCGKPMTKGVDMPIIGKPTFQCAAVLDNGQKIPGHFGKSAKKK